MKTYIDYIHILKFEELWIPKDLLNRHYQQFLEEQKKGEAKLVPYVAPEPTWEWIRNQRDFLLKESDWVMFPDSNPKPNKEVWLTYRQTLRDIPQAFNSPSEVVWPEKPSQ